MDFRRKSFALAVALALCATSIGAEDATTIGTGHSAAGTESACNGCCRQRHRCSGCGLGGENAFPEVVGGISQCLGLQTRAWLVAGFVANAHGNRTGMGNAPLGYNNVADAPVMNQLWVDVQKPIDTGGCGTDWGFHVDYHFGTDGPDNQAFGDQGWDLPLSSIESRVKVSNLSLPIANRIIHQPLSVSSRFSVFRQEPDANACRLICTVLWVRYCLSSGVSTVN